jgi:methylglutaconyl-CoA hydratase
VATQDARFSFADVRQGLIPAMSAPFVVNAIGPRAAKALFVTGRVFDAEHARTIGLVQEVVKDAAALHAAMDRITDEVFAAAPGAVQQAKNLAWEAWGRPIDRDLIDDMAKRLAKRRVSDEAQEGAAAALAGRTPVWGR